jgi:hypothetical protein
VSGQEIDPDARVDDHHDLLRLHRPARPARLQVAFPTNAATQLADPRLRPRLYEQLQRFVDDASLGRASARAQRLPHQAIVDVDIRAIVQESCVSVNGPSAGRARADDAPTRPGCEFVRTWAGRRPGQEVP